MFKVLTKGCTPTRGTKHSAYVDLYSSEDVVIGAGETKVVGLGVSIDLQKIDEYILSTIPYGYEASFIEKSDYFMKTHYLQVALRSSLGKEGLIMPNGIGIIDMDYRDEIKVIINNPLITSSTAPEYIDNSSEYKIHKGDRIAQITLLEHKSYLFGIESDVIRDGGLGSTNTAS